MLKNKLYIYGGESVRVPAHLHFGKYMLNKFQSYGDHVAIINAATDERLTYKELTQQIVDIALSLTHIGVKNGDVVSICSANAMEFMPVVYGTAAAGATFSTIDVSCEKVSFLHKFNIARPKILFCSPSGYNKHKETIKSTTCVEKIIIFGESIEETIGFKDFLSQHANVEDFEAAPVNGSEDLALILFSSGTSGLPKGIKITHLSLLLYVQESKSNDVHTGTMTLGLFEWYTSYGLTLTFYTHQVGSTLVYYSNADGTKCFEIIQQYKINLIPTTPTTLIQLMKTKDVSEYDTSSIQIIAVTGTICDERILEAIKERMPSSLLVIQYYGMTEAGAICQPLYGPFGPRAGSVGCARDLFVIKIVNVDTREPLGPNQRGEICFKSPALMQGYIGESFDYLDEEGFFKTGDIGYYDDDKYLYIVDRIKDLIKYNNYHVVPAELEAVLLQHPAVREVGVVGAQNEEFHELPTAFVVLQIGVQATEKELIEFVDKHVSSRMRLAGGVRFLDALPYCAEVKVDRKKLRFMLNQN